MLAAVDAADPRTQWIARVLGLDIAGSGAMDAEEVRARLNATGIAIRNHPDPDAVDALKKRLVEGFTALKAGDAAGADVIEAEVAAALAGLLSRGRAAEAEPQGGASLRQVAAAGLAWRAACARVEREIEAVKAGVRAALEADDEFDPDEVDEFVGRLSGLDAVPDMLDTELSDMVAELVDVAGPARDKAVTAVLAEVQAKRAYLKTDEWIGVLPDVGVAKVGFIESCTAALDELETALA